MPKTGRETSFHERSIMRSWRALCRGTAPSREWVRRSALRGIVRQFAREGAVQDEGSGEGEDDPEQAARDGARVFAVGSKAKLKISSITRAKENGGVDGFFRPEFRAQIFAGDGERTLERSSFAVARVEPGRIVQHFLGARAGVSDAAALSEARRRWPVPALRAAGAWT